MKDNNDVIEVLTEYKVWFDIDGDKDVSDALTTAISMIKENGELRKENEELKTIRSIHLEELVLLRGTENLKICKLQASLSECKAENIELERQLKLWREGLEHKTHLDKIAELKAELERTKKGVESIVLKAKKEIEELKAENEILKAQLKNSMVNQNLSGATEIRELKAELEHRDNCSICGHSKCTCLKVELTELKAKYEELEYDWDCKSGNENCDGYNEKGFPCYRHLTDSSERLEQELDDLKKAVASEGLGVAEIAKALMDKAMEWYPYGDKIPMPKQCELLAKAIHEAQTKYKKEKGEK